MFGHVQITYRKASQNQSHDHFYDSISKFYQCSIWGFCRCIFKFFSICISKKIADVIKFLGISKKYVSENKIYFCSRKKSNISLIKKIIFVFHTIFKLDFITLIIYCIIHRCVSSHFILSLFSKQSERSL